MAVALLVLDYWRFRNDDGSEVGASWIAAQNTQGSIMASNSLPTPFRLRFAIDDRTQDAPGGLYGLTCSRNGGSFLAVGSSSTYVQGAVSGNVVDGANTTNQLSVGGSAVYVTRPGVVNNTAATSGSIAIPLGSATEIEWSLLIPAGAVAGGDTLDFHFSFTGAASLQQFAGNVRLLISSIGTGGSGSQGWPNNTFTPLPQAAMIRNF